MKQTAAIEYLNLDVECKSPHNLTPILEYFGDAIFVLYNGESDSGFFTVFEPEHCEDERNIAEIHALHILDLIENLPAQRRCLWDDCQSKVFDFGFRSGITPSSYFEDLSPETLTRIAAVGASVRITIYPMAVGTRQIANLPGDDGLANQPAENRLGTAWQPAPVCSEKNVRLIKNVLV